MDLGGSQYAAHVGPLRRFQACLLAQLPLRPQQPVLLRAVVQLPGGQLQQQLLDGIPTWSPCPLTSWSGR